MKKTLTPQFLSPQAHSEHDFVNVGVYGYPDGGESGKRMTRWLERLAHQMGGAEDALRPYVLFPGRILENLSQGSL